MEAYSALVEIDQFSAARGHFERVVAKLSTGETAKLDHSALEEVLTTEGREIVRRLFQAHLNLRALQEPRGAVTGVNGVVRTHLRPSARPLITVFGEVEVNRQQCGARDEVSLHPLDAELNLPVEIQSHGVQRVLAEQAAKGSFDEAVAEVGKTTGGSVSKRQAVQLARRAAQDFDAFYASGEANDPDAEIATDLLVITSDGKGLVVRPEDLRPATRKAAAEERHKLKTRLCKGEKRNRKRMALVTAVYGIAPFVRTPDDILNDLRPVKDAAKKRPKPKNKRVWATIEKETEAAITDLFEEAQRRDPGHVRRWVAPVDGNRPQIDLIRAEAARRAVEVILVLDIIHVIEYLWKAAYCILPEATREAEKWVTERLEAILCGKASNVAAGIRRSATKRHLSKKARTPMDKCADYLLAHPEMVRYDLFLKAGFPIATGVIEGACRHLVKDRMDITGARWTLVGAEAVLRLRALRSSDDFDDYWRFHLAQERARNHLAHYADGVVRRSNTAARATPPPRLRLVVPA